MPILYYFSKETVKFRTFLIQKFNRSILFILRLKLVKDSELINLSGRLFHAFTARFWNEFKKLSERPFCFLFFKSVFFSTASGIQNKIYKVIAYLY